MYLPLKADFHIHTKEDHLDSVRNGAREIIDKAHEKGFQVISITNHNTLTFSNNLRDYAGERGILLIPGIEATIQGKHVLLLNVDGAVHEIKTFSDLRRNKRKDNLVIAPHPYFPNPRSLRSQLEDNIDIFDAIEYSHFYTKRINFNSMALVKAEQHQLPMVGTSDAHMMLQFGTTYSMVYAEKKDVGSVVNAVKEGRIEVVTQPLGLSKFTKILMRLIAHNLYISLRI